MLEVYAAVFLGIMIGLVLAVIVKQPTSDCTGTPSKEHELWNCTSKSDQPKTVFICKYCLKRFTFNRKEVK